MKRWCSFCNHLLTLITTPVENSSLCSILPASPATKTKQSKATMQPAKLFGVLLPLFFFSLVVTAKSYGYDYALDYRTPSPPSTKSYPWPCTYTPSSFIAEHFTAKNYAIFKTFRNPFLGLEAFTAHVGKVGHECDWDAPVLNVLESRWRSHDRFYREVLATMEYSRIERRAWPYTTPADDALPDNTIDTSLALWTPPAVLAPVAPVTSAAANSTTRPTAVSTWAAFKSATFYHLSHLPSPTSARRLQPAYAPRSVQLSFEVERVLAVARSILLSSPTSLNGNIKPSVLASTHIPPVIEEPLEVYVPIEWNVEKVGDILRLRLWSFEANV